MNTWTLMKRILKQFRRDKRSMALMIVAPIFVLTLMWLVLDGDSKTLNVALVDVPEPSRNARGIGTPVDFHEFGKGGEGNR